MAKERRDDTSLSSLVDFVKVVAVVDVVRLVPVSCEVLLLLAVLLGLLFVFMVLDEQPASEAGGVLLFSRWYRWIKWGMLFGR